MKHASVRYLPLAMHLLAPELRALDFPEESRADCSNCPMALKPGEDPSTTERVAFLTDVRCCTYHPFMPNFLVGRALRRGGVGADKLKARLTDRDGVLARGVAPQAAYNEQYNATRTVAFGKDISLKCPYWVEGPLSCSVWQDRSATCRTWHCRHEQGVYGHVMWSSVRVLLRKLELSLADWCVTQVNAPDPQSAKMRDWVRYYEACADAAERVEIEDLTAMSDDETKGMREKVRLLFSALVLPTPELLAPKVDNVRPLPDGTIELTGYTPYDPVVVPGTIFQLLSRLDGVALWRDVLAELALPELNEQLVRELLWRQILTPPLDAHGEIVA